MKLGKQLHELLGWSGPMTGRQFRAWNSWLKRTAETPSLTDYYLMAIGAELRRNRGIDAQLEDMRLTLRAPVVQDLPPPPGFPGPLTKEGIAKVQMTMFMARGKSQ